MTNPSDGVALTLAPTRARALAPTLALAPVLTLILTLALTLTLTLALTRYERWPMPAAWACSASKQHTSLSRGVGTPWPQPTRWHGPVHCRVARCKYEFKEPTCRIPRVLLARRRRLLSDGARAR